MIEVLKLEKTFRVARHHRGFLGSFRNLVETDYDVVRAVDGVSFSIAAGEFVGFIGPNGAGKSTTIKMLTGVLEPSGGEVRVGGLSPRRDRIAHTAQIGVVFGQRTQLWWDLPVIESYTLLRHVYKVSDSDFRAQLARLEALLDLRTLLDVPVRKLSLGQRMRCELGAALLHAPRLLFLDEPTIGLDVLAKEAIREFLATENRERGTTILLTTHDLSDIERLCPRMILIDHGHVVYDGAVEAIRREYGSERRLVVDFESAAPAELPDGVDVEERGAARLVLRFRRDRIGPAALIAWLGERAPIADLSLEEPPIERIVAELYRRGRT
ncbi:MAG: ATP-binding cassette domain-containing protein [Myxococcota bacterium]